MNVFIFAQIPSSGGLVVNNSKIFITLMDYYHLLLQSVKDYGIFMLDTRGHIISWNEGAQRINGYSANEIIGKHFSIFYNEEDQAAGKPEMELRVALSDGKYEEEGWRIRKDGSTFWANVTITPVFDERKRHVGFSKVTRDLTERRNAELAARQSEERFRLFISQVKDYAMFLLDVNGYIVTWNEGAQRIKGYEASEIVGKHFSIFYIPEEKDVKPKMELRVARATGKYEEEGWRVKKNGDWFWANVLITAIYNDNKELIGFSKVTRDLTERKQAEEFLRQSNQRFRQIAEELNVTNKQLESANKHLEQFASVASHDLKEPLRKISMLTDIVLTKEDGRLSESSRINLEKIIQAARRMDSMIQEFLAFSTLNEKVEPECVSLQSLVDETVELLEQPIREKGAVIKTDSLPKANVVPGQFRQIFQNLISNALKFSKEGVPPEIVISHKFLSSNLFCLVEKPAKTCLEIRVADNGIGFDPSQAEKIFGLFKRLHSSSRYEGTGLGLAICKRIVENHHGKLRAESQPSQGSVFIVTIPYS